MLLPRGGFSATFVPCNTAQEPAILDYVAVSEHDSTRMQGDMRFVLVVQIAAVLATTHHPLALELRLPGQLGPEHGNNNQDNKDPMRYAKLNRRRRVRRRWLGWRELTEGQLAAFVPAKAWSDPVALQRALRWAGRAAAPKGRLKTSTPYDQLERQLTHDRRVPHDREARKVLSRWVISARAWQRRWRFEQDVA